MATSTSTSETTSPSIATTLGRFASAYHARRQMAEGRQFAFEVSPGLYVGGLRSLGEIKALNITHVLSVINFEVAGPELCGCQALRVPLKDDERANLLEHLPAALRFIESALPRPASSTASASGTDVAAGRVLVHCQAGVSRSCSVITAYIMRTRGVDAQEALRIVRLGCPCADPNEGFMAQLQMFGDMRCSLDEEHPVYRSFYLQQIARQYHEEGYVDPDSFAQMPTSKEDLAKVGTYRCRKCRHLLASANNVVPEDTATGHKAFTDYRTVKGHHVVDDGHAETSVFLHPMAWMAGAVVGAVQGKLYCPGCNARLGSFNWAGITNAAGAWVTPAFQLHTNKMDFQGTAGSASVNVRVPLLGVSTPSARSVAAPATPSAAVEAAAAHAEPTDTAGQAAAGVGPSGAAAAAVAPPGLDDGGQAAVVGQAGDVAAALAPPAPPAGQAAADAAQAAGARQAADAGPSGNVTAAVAPPAAAAAGHAAAAGPSGRRAAWFTHLILDCDGVMVDSERASCESLRLAILQVTGFDIPHEFPTDYQAVFGMDVRGCVAHYKTLFSREDWTDVTSIAARVQEAKEPLYMELTRDGIAAFDGVTELIAQARELGLVVGVASSGAPAKIHHNLTSAGLIHLLPPHFIVSASEVAAGKPAPDVYIEALRRTGCSNPRRALVVEDAVNGLLAAIGAGTFAVGITNSLPCERLGKVAHLVVDHLNQIDLQSLCHPDATPSLP